MFLFLLILTLFIYIYGTSKRRMGPFYFLGFVLALISGFRGESVGIDTHSYHEFFNDLIAGENSGFIEFGYLQFLKLIIFIGGTQQLVLLVFACFTTYCFCKFILRYSNNPYLSLLIFVFFAPLYISSLNQMRQYLVIGVFLAYLIPLIQEKQLIKYIILILLCTFMIHFSAIVLLPLYFVLNKKIPTYSKALSLVFFNLIIGSLVFLVLMTHYGYFILLRSDKEVGLAVFFIQILISIFVLLFEKSISKKSDDRIIFFNMAFLSIFILSPLFISKNFPSEILMRINSYFLPFLIIIIPDILNAFTKKSKRILVFLTITFFSFYFYRSTVILGEFYSLYPYEINTKLFIFF